MRLIRNKSQKKPVFWHDEVSGEMKRIIAKYLQDQVLDEYELSVLRGYVHQWVRGFPVIPDDYNGILTMSQEQLDNYIWDVLIEHGIDPF